MSAESRWVYFVSFVYEYKGSPRWRNLEMRCNAPVVIIEQIEEMEEALLDRFTPTAREYINDVTILHYQLLREEAMP